MAIPNIRSNGGNNALNSLQHHLGSAGEEEEEDEEDEEEEEEEEEEEGPVEPHLQQQHLQGCHDPVYSDVRSLIRTEWMECMLHRKGKKLSNSQVCCRAQLCLAAA